MIAVWVCMLLVHPSCYLLIVGVESMVELSACLFGAYQGSLRSCITTPTASEVQQILGPSDSPIVGLMSKDTAFSLEYTVPAVL